MNAGNLLIICLSVTVCLWGHSTAIECYHCQTATDGSGCGDKDGFDPNMPVSSELASTKEGQDMFTNLLGSLGSGECAYCIKTKYKTNGQEFVQRSCITHGTGMKVDDCVDQDAGGHKAVVCVCDGDRCNSGTLDVPTIPLLVVAALTTLIKNLMQ